jgi:uncharacterized protein
MAKARSDQPATPTPAAARLCAICGRRPATLQHRPFCSARCANIDLGRWLKGNYSVETDEAPPAAAENEEG